MSNESRDREKKGRIRKANQRNEGKKVEVHQQDEDKGKGIE